MASSKKAGIPKKRRLTDKALAKRIERDQAELAKRQGKAQKTLSNLTVKKPK